MNDFIPGLGTEARNEEYAPKAAKGGVFAPADIKIIKQALHFFIQEAHPLTESEERQITNLLHRLGRID
jgi:hypothetical protein